MNILIDNGNNIYIFRNKTIYDKNIYNRKLESFYHIYSPIIFIEEIIYQKIIFHPDISNYFQYHHFISFIF